MTVTRALALAVFVTLLLSACSSLTKLDWLMNVFTLKSDLAQLRIVADADANRNTATALDLVFVYDKDVVSLLPQSGPEWFEKRRALVANHPAAFTVVSLQLPPATTLDAPVPKLGNQPVAAILYANYIDKDGQFPINLTAFTRAAIRLKAGSIEYSGGDGKTAAAP